MKPDIPEHSSPLNESPSIQRETFWGLDTSFPTVTGRNSFLTVSTGRKTPITRGLRTWLTGRDLYALLHLRYIYTSYVEKIQQAASNECEETKWPRLGHLHVKVIEQVNI